MDLSAKVADQSLKARATRVAAIAAAYADEVDKAGRFPNEAIDALKSERLMGIQIPVDCGGEGRTTSEIAELCTIIAQSCAASAMRSVSFVIVSKHATSSRRELLNTIFVTGRERDLPARFRSSSASASALTLRVISRSPRPTEFVSIGSIRRRV